MVSHSYFLKIRDSGTHSFALPTLAGVAFVLLDELLHLGGISRTEADGIQDDVPAVALEGPQSIRFKNQGKESRYFRRGRNCPFTSFLLDNLLQALIAAIF